MDGVTTQPLYITAYKPIPVLSFVHDGKTVGTLDFSGPEMKFNGQADEAAKVFFNYLATYFQQRLAEERKRALTELKAVLYP